MEEYEDTLKDIEKSLGLSDVRIVLWCDSTLMTQI